MFPESKLRVVYIVCILAVTQNYCSAKLIQHQLLLKYAANPYKMPNFGNKVVVINVAFFFFFFLLVNRLCIAFLVLCSYFKQELKVKL